MTGLTLRDWYYESETVGRRIVESDDRVTSTKRITEQASPDWAVTLHDGQQVTAEITLMTEPGMNLMHEPLVTGQALSPHGRWYLRVSRHNNDPPSQADDAPVKAALRQIISQEAPVVAARIEDRHGGAARMREWQASHPWDKPPWYDEAQACCDAILYKCVNDVRGFAATHMRNKIRLAMVLTKSSEGSGVVISPLHNGYGGRVGDLSHLRDHAQQRIDSKSHKQQSHHSGEKWLILICAHPWLIENMRDAFGEDDKPLHDQILKPLDELDMYQFDEVWIAAPLNSNGDMSRTIKLSVQRQPLVISCSL